jgi:hypothetical protein
MTMTTRIVNKLPDRRLTEIIDAQKFWLELKQARDGMLNADDEDEVRRWCRCAALRILETGVCLAGSEGGFLAQYPAQKIAFTEIMRLSHQPGSHVGHLLPLMKSFGGWLTREAERHNRELQKRTRYPRKRKGFE